MKEQRTARAEWWQGMLRLLLAALVLAGVSIACSVGQVITGSAPGPAPTTTKTPRPTFTPLVSAQTPVVVEPVGVRGTLPPGVTAQSSAQPVAGGTPGVISVGSTNLIIYATETRRVLPTSPPTVTRTPSPETPQPDVVPMAVVKPDTLAGRRGPGTNFERIGQASKGAELQVLGKIADGSWYRVCCMANQPVWVASDAVDVTTGADAIAVLTPPPPPPPLPATPRPPAAPRAQPTIAPTRGLPFDIARGPEFPIKRDNGLLTIWVKAYEGPADNQKPLGGYILKVTRDGADVSDNVETYGDRPFDKTSAREGAYEYNLKFELYNAGEADWEIFLTRPGGFQVSPITRFTTKGDSYRNLVVFIAYFLAR